ncbi:MAG: fumarylacetoacetase [Sphingomonadales bacterium]|nr:fumarylacetoacetase [Sphingomonadales bacterium]
MEPHEACAAPGGVAASGRTESVSIDHTHDPQASSWVAGADAHADFPVQNLPLGIFSPPGARPRIGTAIGDHILDLAALATAGGLGALAPDLRAALGAPRLNPLFALDAPDRRHLRHAVFAALTDRAGHSRVAPHLRPAADCALHLPFAIGDYTDFYVGIHHATAIGRLLRPDHPLLANYKYVPIAYHGRASSVQVSGAAVIRPRGQVKTGDGPEYRACERLDYEVELGLWIAGGNALGEVVPISAASARIGGVCLLNDWSARDLQVWEYQPLGPFLAKNFLTTVSPWVVTGDALAPFRVAPMPRPAGDPAPLPYLADDEDARTGGLAITLEARLASRAMREGGLAPQCLSRVRAADAMYWTPAQMVAHHTANGCNLGPGDLLGTGTLSGAGPGSEGSLMELTRAGSQPIALASGESRRFLEDGDEVTLHARAERAGWRSIGFGPCTGTVGAAR